MARRGKSPFRTSPDEIRTLGLKFTVTSMKMRRGMVLVLHSDDDAVEGRDSGMLLTVGGGCNAEAKTNDSRLIAQLSAGDRTVMPEARRR
jgi:hypothetical protein